MSEIQRLHSKKLFSALLLGFFILLSMDQGCWIYSSCSITSTVANIKANSLFAARHKRLQMLKSWAKCWKNWLSGSTCGGDGHNTFLVSTLSVTSVYLTCWLLSGLIHDIFMDCCKCFFVGFFFSFILSRPTHCPRLFLSWQVDLYHMGVRIKWFKTITVERSFFGTLSFAWFCISLFRQYNVLSILYLLILKSMYYWLLRTYSVT